MAIAQDIDALALKTAKARWRAERNDPFWGPRNGPLDEFLEKNLADVKEDVKRRLAEIWFVQRKLDPGAFMATLEGGHWYTTATREEAFKHAGIDYIAMRVYSGLATKKPYEVRVEKRKWDAQFDRAECIESYIVRLEIEKVKITKDAPKKRKK